MISHANQSATEYSDTLQVPSLRLYLQNIKSDGSSPPAPAIKRDFAPLWRCSQSLRLGSGGEADSGTGQGMRVYRLVNSAHDPIAPGEKLVRASDHSRKKLGEGMYFAWSADYARQFANTSHGHTYTHLLTCHLKNLTEDNFVDLVKEPNLIARSEFKDLPIADRRLAYCKKHNKVGVIWKAGKFGWIEVCLYSEYIRDVVIIESAERMSGLSG